MALGLAGAGAVGTMLAPSPEPSEPITSPKTTSQSWGHWYPEFLDHVAMDQYLYIPFLGGWTSIYQLFWCSPGVQGFDTTAMLGELVSTWYPINMVIGMYHFWIMLDRMKRETSWNAGLGLMLLISADVFSQLVHKKQCQPLFSRSIRSLKRHLPIKHDIKTISSELPWPMKLLWM